MQTSIPTSQTRQAAVTQTQSLKKLQFSAGEWPPYLGAKLPGQGMAAQLIRDIFADAGYQVSFHFLPWPRAYRETLHGQYAATAIWMYAPERAVDFYYSAAVLEEEFVLFQLKAQPIQFDKLEDLTGLELGGGFGYSYGAAFDAAIANGVFKMTRVSQTLQNFQRLLKGRIQAFPEEKQVGYHILRSQLPQSQHLISHADTVILRNQSFVLFPKQSTDSQLLLQIFQHGLQHYQSSGRYQRYFDITADSQFSASKPAADKR
jgi:polar amino acid transport system substrate-binding protein